MAGNLRKAKPINNYVFESLYVQEQDYPIFFSKTTYGRVFITRLSRYYIACTLILLKKTCK